MMHTFQTAHDISSETLVVSHTNHATTHLVLTAKQLILNKNNDAAAVGGGSGHLSAGAEGLRASAENFCVNSLTFQTGLFLIIHHTHHMHTIVKPCYAGAEY
jgi:hypothetical protein